MSNNNCQKNKAILFVCLGNICRSPACEAICRSVYQNNKNQSGYNAVNMKISSAAVSQFHINESPDFRIQDVCLKNGIDISHYRSKLIQKTDWMIYDYIVALDSNIYDILIRMRPLDSKAKILLFNAPNGIVDPYYCGKMAFIRMFQEIQMNMKSFLNENKIL